MSQDKIGKRRKIKMYWENSNMYRGVEGKAMMRLNGIIVMNPEIDQKMWLQEDEEMYRIGKVRTLQRFFDSFGIDTVEKRVQVNLCIFNCTSYDVNGECMLKHIPMC